MPAYANQHDVVTFPYHRAGLWGGGILDPAFSDEAHDQYYGPENNKGLWEDQYFLPLGLGVRYRITITVPNTMPASLPADRIRLIAWHDLTNSWRYFELQNQMYTEAGGLREFRVPPWGPTIWTGAGQERPTIDWVMGSADENGDAIIDSTARLTVCSNGSWPSYEIDIAIVANRGARYYVE